MKIAYFVSTFPPDIGGMGKVCFEEAKRMSEEGHEVFVFCLKYKGKDYKEDENYPFKVERIKPLLKLGDGGVSPFLFLKLRGFDLVHFHFPFFGNYHNIFLSKIIFGQKYILTYHMDGQMSGIKKILGDIYNFFWARLTFKKAQKVVVVDNETFLNSKFKKYIKEEQKVEIFNGVDSEVFKPWPKELKQTYKKNKRIILFVGNLLPVKRLDLLIRALKDLRNDNTILLVVGSGYKEKEYKALVSELNLKDRVKFEGKCTDVNKLVNYYNLADFSVMPSDYESFSLVLIESLSCGCPVIASDITGSRGRVENNVDGFLFKKDSLKDLVEKIDDMNSLNNEEREKMGQKGRKKVLKEYSWDSHMEKVKQVYGI